MAKIAPGDLARFASGGWKAYTAALVFGSDEGLVRETADRLIAAALGPNPDPLNLIELDGDAIAADPPRLADEMRSVNMFGGDRVVHVRAAAKAPVSAVAAATEERMEGTFLVMEAGDLKVTATSLRGLAEKSRTMAVVACYSDSDRSLAQLVDEALAEHKIGITREARQVLVTSLGADRGLSRAEIDKLALYALGAETITIGMVQDIVADAGRHDTSALIDRAFAGDLTFIEPEANRLFSAGGNASAILSQSLTLAMMLRRARRSSLQEAGRSQRLHFSRLPVLERALNQWTEARLYRAVALLAEALQNTRTSPALSQPIVIRALWSVARLAKSGRADDE